MTLPHVKLQPNVDELLRDFPVTEPDFEAQAKAIEARLQGPLSAGALSDDALFGAPDLAAEPAEPPLPSQVRAAPKGHFAEMARRSLQQPGEDAAALAKELLAATAQSRRPNAELVERMRAASKSAPTTTPLPLSEPRRERNSGVVPRTEATPKPPVAEASSDKRGVVVALVGVALAAAAAVVLFAGGSPEGSTTSATLAAERASQAPAAAAPAAPTPVAAAPQDEGVMSPDSLPQAPTAVAKSAEAARTKPSVAAGAAPAAKPGAATPASAGPVVELREDEPQRVAAAEPPAKPLEEPPLLPAQGHSGSVPLQPSSGAVSTALGSVRSGAQACLAGQTEAVTATVTFAADGHVLRVSAGGPSGSCIQAALSKAKIAPFAKESFSATTTIRPP